MYLKALELQGFKSFPEKTRLTFEKDITAIVGPNGSGKSNISDAIMWVMGEQRSKALRGGKMEDVIFGGTEKRAKTGFAQVSLVLDNSERFFDTDSTELMITRRYYRSGESEYYINRESVRLKDITELLMDTGLGRYGYSIIGQGKISEVVAAKSGDRRDLFEEAAGISRFRYRKDESERKLAHTDENLVRINDKIDELKIQVGPLQEQAEVAKIYLLLRDELRGLEVSVWMETLDKLAERADTIRADWEQNRAQLDEAHAELERLYAASENYAEKMREKDILAENTRIVIAATSGRIAELDSDYAVLKNSEQNLIQRQSRLQDDIDEQGARAAVLEEQIANHNSRIVEIDLELLSLDAQLKTIVDRMSDNATGEEGTKREISLLYAQKSEKTAEASRVGTVISMLGEDSAEFEQAQLRRGGLIEEAGRRHEALERELISKQSSLKDAQERASEISNVIGGYKMRIDGRQAKAKTLGERMTQLTIEFNSVSSRAAMLAEMEKDFEGYSKSVKTVMREAERGTLKGIFGPVANLVKTQDKYALAIETALGASMQSIVVDTQEQGKTAIEMLKRQDAGRATFLPVNTIKPAELKRSPKDEEGYLGTAFELASFDKRFENIFSNLLARTVVAESLSDAVSMSKKHDNQLRIVTLDGQMINAGGSMTGGSAAKNAGILSRANELKELSEKKQILQKTQQECASNLAEAERELSAAKYELQTAEFELSEISELVRECQAEVNQTTFLSQEANKAVGELKADAQNAAARREEADKRSKEAQADALRLEKELAALEEKLQTLSQSSQEHERAGRQLSEEVSAISERRSAITSESSTTQNAIEQLRKLLSDLQSDGDTRRKTIEELDAERRAAAQAMEELSEQIRLEKTSLEKLRDELTATINQKLELEGKRTKSEKQAQESNGKLLDIERLGAALEQKKISSEMEEKQIIDKLWDSYELSRTAAQSVRQELENYTAATKRISTIKREISSLGNPNLGAIEEYDRVSQRYNFLTEQRDDVEKAKRDLEKIIAEITGEMKEIFRREFELINESFRNTFLELFGGGRAALVLEDEEDILNCGIEIKVQPPGKALTTLSLLSGGETAFVAIALYFAILKIRPSPFCVMDEIEAALDEANVDKFASYMRGMTNKTQFIVITHRRGTMEESDMLYGVTMQEKGVSQVISVDLAEAEKSIAK